MSMAINGGVTESWRETTENERKKEKISVRENERENISSGENGANG